MNIGFSTSVVQRGKTGIAQYVFALLRAFDRSNSEHSFTLFVLEDDRPLFNELSDRFTIVSVAEKYRPAVKNILWHQQILPGLARKLDLDLLHVPSYRRLMWKAPCPRVATIHDLAPFRVARKYDLARMFYGRVVVKRLARMQEAIITISENTARDIQEFFGIPRNALHVIHNGVDSARFFPGREQSARGLVAAKFGLAQPFLLYIARLEHPGKNHVRLIQAFELFKQKTGTDWQLVFGGSDWHGAEAIHSRIAASPFRKDIRSIGFVSDLDLPELYRAATQFVYPSLYEGFGLPPIEAMACGCPVLCSDKGALAEVVGDAALIINPDDVQSIANGLFEVYSDVGRRTELRRRGFERASHFSWDRAARETMEIYQNTTAARKKLPINRRVLNSGSFAQV